MVERNVAPAPVGGIGAEDCLGLGQLNPLGDRPRAEAREDDEMHRADTRAGEHQGDGFEVRRHVHGHAVAALDPDRPQRSRYPLDLLEQLGVREDPLYTVLVQRDQRRPASVAAVDLSVEAGVREIGLAADEPTERGDLLRRPLEHLVPLAEPGNARGRLRPERVGLVERAALNLADDWPDQIDVRRHVGTPSQGLD